MLKQYQLADEAIQRSITNFPEGTYNWFFVQEFNIQLKFHTGRFNEIENLLIEINKYKNNSLYQNWIERFKFLEAFFYYLKITGKITSKNAEKRNVLNTFRLHKFLNEVPNHSKDKKGSNITLLILQVLFLLEDQKYDTLIDRAESLKVYTHRYLKGEGTYRSHCFIKMLLCLPAGNFERKQVEQKAKKYLDRLQAMPIEKAKQSAELEVMPYEMLWEFAMESLDRPKK